MQELRILRWCDVCHKESGAFVEVTNVFVISVSAPGVGRPLVRKLEVCEQHEKLPVELREMLRQCGTSPGEEPPRTVEQPALFVEDKPKRPGQSPSEQRHMLCKFCGEDLQRGSMAEHLIILHHARRIKQPAKCPDCSAKHELAQSMVTHRRRAHGYDSIDALAATVKVGK
jgi:hypothetical protein